MAKKYTQTKKKTLAYEGFEPAQCTVITAWFKRKLLRAQKALCQFKWAFSYLMNFFSSKLINLCRKFKKSKKHKFPQVKKNPTPIMNPNPPRNYPITAAYYYSIPILYYLKKQNKKI